MLILDPRLEAMLAGMATLCAGLLLPTPGQLPASARTRACLRMGITDDAQKWLTDNLGPITSKRGMGGGSGWASLTRYAVEGQTTEFVVKASGTRPLENMFLGEALGLKALGASGALAIPKVFHYADGWESGSYLIMEYMEMSGRADQKKFGRAMAELHLAEPLAAEARAGRFGFDVDNTIGGTPQPNGWTDGSGTAAWVDFFREKRLGFQVRTAGDAQVKRQWEATLAATDGLADLFDGVDVRRLLHCTFRRVTAAASPPPLHHRRVTATA